MRKKIIRSALVAMLTALLVAVSIRTAFAPESGWYAQDGHFRVESGSKPMLGFLSQQYRDGCGGGLYHIPVNGSELFEEYRRVAEWDGPGDASQFRYYHFQPTAGSGGPNDVYELTVAPHVSPKNRTDFAGIPGGQTPEADPSFSYKIIIVGGNVTIPGSFPRNPGDQPSSVTIQYAVEPPDVQLADLPERIMIDIWDPSNASCRRKWYLSDRVGSVSWNGLLDGYVGPEDYEPMEVDVGYCRASKMFWRMRVCVEDRYVSGPEPTPCNKELNFEPADFAIWLTGMEATWPEIQAGQVFGVWWQRSGGFEPIAFEVRVDKAFKPLGKPPDQLPYTAADLIHPVGSLYAPPGAPNPAVIAVYETGSRSSVPQTDLGLRRVRVDGWDAKLEGRSATLDLTVMRNAELTAYFTPHEQHPFYIGPEGDLYDPVGIEIAGEGTIYVDSEFAQAVEVEGNGKLFKIRWLPGDVWSGEDASGERQYLHYEGTWSFSDKALNGRNGSLSAQSTAQLVNKFYFPKAQPPDPKEVATQRSYYNPDLPDENPPVVGRYRIPKLSYYADLFIKEQMLKEDTPPRTGSPVAPPEGRVVDDAGDHEKQDVPEWMDIYFMEWDGQIGVDPRLIGGFGGSTWRELMGGRLQYPDDPIKVYK